MNDIDMKTINIIQTYLHTNINICKHMCIVCMLVSIYLVHYVVICKIHNKKKFGIFFSLYLVIVLLLSTTKNKLKQII